MNDLLDERYLESETVCELLLTRRRLLKMSGAAACVMPLSGCLFLLGILRIGMRGRSISRGMRTANGGKRGQSGTLGRQTAASIQLYRLVRSARTLGRLQRLGELEATEDSEQASRVETSEDGRETYNVVDGDRVCTTVLRGPHIIHNSYVFGDNIGRSVPLNDGEHLAHYDFRDEQIGLDIYEKTRIKHVDANNEVAGFTPFKVVELPNDRSRYEITDDTYLREELEKLNAQSTPEDRAIVRRLMPNIDGQAACLNSPGTVDCTETSIRASNALRRVEERFRTK